MQILVVDDDLASREKMEVILGTYGRCQAAESGSEAISYFRRALEQHQAFNLVTLDIAMPDLDGTEVLLQMRRLEKDYQIPNDQRSKIIMVTGRSDKEQVICCVEGGCDDYIAKPFNHQIMSTKLKHLGCVYEIPGEIPGKIPGEPPEETLCGTQDDDVSSPSSEGLSAGGILKEINRSLSRGDIELPAQPLVLTRFRELADSGAGLDQVAELLQQDMTITAKIMRVANSALFRGFDIARNATQAVSRLGMSAVDQIVTAMANQRMFASDSDRYRPLLQSLWRHSLASALAAQSVSKIAGLRLAIDPFVAGLMHDMGAMALLRIIAQMESRSHFSKTTTPNAVADTVVANHAKFGAKLLKKWHFEPIYVETTLSHEKIAGNIRVSDELAVVHLSNLIAKTIGCPGLNPKVEYDLDQTPSARQLGIGTPRLIMIMQKCQAEMEASEIFSQPGS